MDTTGPHIDNRLFQQIAKGDEAAFRQLFDNWRNKVYFFILHIVESEEEAEELTQDVFLRIWVSRRVLGKVEHASNYLFVAARNRALDYIEKRKRDRKMKSDLEATNNFSVNSTEEEVDFNISRKLHDEAVSHLPRQQELVYRMNREQGMSRREIAGEMNISEHTVKNHLTEAIRSIKEYLRTHGDMAVLLVIWASL